MIKAAVLGSPIAHSLSPKIHTKAYEILGLESHYSALEIKENEFADFFHNLDGQALEWNGFSLTMPLKEVVLKYCKESDAIARQINSANTLYRSADVWRATSTDYLAFKNLLNVSEGARVAIIGGGGTARAAIGALNSKISKVDVLLRSPDRMPGLIRAAPDLAIRELEMSAPLNGYDLIIQTTPTGVFDEYVKNTEEVTGTLLEALYKPWPTKLSEHFNGLGGKVISGKELLVEQALFQIELFAEKSFDFSSMRKELLSHILND